MRNQEEIALICFGSFSDRSAFDFGDEQILENFRDNKLLLPPHDLVEIGNNPFWNEDPLGDDNWRFQYSSLFWLERIRQAAANAGDCQILSEWERLLMSWVVCNPVGDGRSDYAWFDMAVGTRVLVLLNAVVELGWQPWLEKAIRDHGEFLFAEENYEGKGNHSLHQDMGLLCAGFALEEEGWMRLAEERMTNMFFNAVDKEGVSQEGSLDYQYRNFRWYEEALSRLRIAGRHRALAWLERLLKMPELLRWGVRSDGNLIMWGDTNEHKAIPQQHLASLLNLEITVKEDDPTGLKIFESGYFIHRRPGSARAVFTTRFGPGRATAVHGHDDGSGITWDIEGDVILRDSGIYAYEGGERRLYVRGAEAHSVCVVEGAQRYTSARTELLAQSSTDQVVYASLESRAMKGTIWNRSVAYFPSFDVIAVDDRLVSLLDPIKVHQLWQLGPAFEYESDRLACNKRHFLKFHQAQYDSALEESWRKGEEDPIAGWYSPRYRELIPAATAQFTRSGQRVRFSTILVAGRRSERMPEVSLFPSSQSFRFVVKTSRGRFEAEFDSKEVCKFEILNGM